MAAGWAGVAGEAAGWVSVAASWPFLLWSTRSLVLAAGWSVRTERDRPVLAAVVCESHCQDKTDSCRGFLPKAQLVTAMQGFAA